ncbi:MAG TPA: DoxX family protein [Myxococcaceae bacterium]|jgi:putative oxidoreductase
MSSLVARWSSWSPYFLSLLRIMAGFLFIQYGTTKLLGFPAPVMPDGSTAPVTSLPGVAGLFEMVGGTLMLVGLFSRPVAFVLSGQMAAAYFMVHASQGFWPVLNGGTPSTLFCFIWLYISSAGPGPWSVDALMSRKRA